MNYLMVKRELEALSNDLAQLAEGIIGPDPPAPKSERKAPLPGRCAMPQGEVGKEIDYIKAKLEALSMLVWGAEGSNK